MACDHKKTERVWVPSTDYDGEDDSHWETERVSAMVDIDLHRFKCSRCGEIGYYSGRAKEHYEKGTRFDGIEGLE